jgi:hypothetical protein
MNPITKIINEERTNVGICKSVPRYNRTIPVIAKMNVINWFLRVLSIIFLPLTSVNNPIQAWLSSFLAFFGENRRAHFR